MLRYSLMYISRGEQRERELFIENTVSDFQMALRNRKVQDALGSAALSLFSTSQKLYLPHLRDGIVSAPAGYKDTDLVPIVAMKEGERLRLDDTLAVMSATQRGNMNAELKRWQYEEDGFFESPLTSTDELDERLVEANREAGGFPVEVDGAHGRIIGARADGRRLHDGKGFQIIQGRPMVVLSVDDYAENEAASILTHELEHVRQFMDYPLFYTIPRHFENQRLEQELRAYQLQTRFCNAINIPTFRAIGSKVVSTTVLHAYKVEAHRRKIARPGEEYQIYSEQERNMLLELTSVGLRSGSDTEMAVL
jgi:hypothetical protein